MPLFVQAKGADTGMTGLSRPEGECHGGRRGQQRVLDQKFLNVARSENTAAIPVLEASAGFT
jgi:hypothetical protein